MFTILDKLFDESAYPMQQFPRKQLNRALEPGRTMGLYVTYLSLDSRLSQDALTVLKESPVGYTQHNPLCLAETESQSHKYVIELQPAQAVKYDWQKEGLRWQPNLKIDAYNPFSVLTKVGEITQLNDNFFYIVSIYQKRTGGRIPPNQIERKLAAHAITEHMRAIEEKANRPSAFMITQSQRRRS